MIEMGVPRIQDEVMLHGEGCNPDIIARNRSPPATQLRENRRVMVSCAICALDGPNPGLVQEFAQDADLGFPPPGKLCPHADFRQNHKRNDQESRPFERLYHRFLAGTEIDEPIGIDEDSHFQSSGLILSRDSNASDQPLRSTLSEGRTIRRSER